MSSNSHTKSIANFASNNDVPLKVAKHGVDIGVDTSAAHKRSTAKQKQPIRETHKRETYRIYC